MIPLCCDLPPRPLRENDEILTALPEHRAGLIRSLRTRWVTGSKITWAMKGGTDSDRLEVLRAADRWSQVAAGIRLERIASWADAMVRITFDRDSGSWSYIGTDCLERPYDLATMNFGWALGTSEGRQTALHEWGHALGFHHEHQNPFSGIVWDEDAVAREFAGYPNYWNIDKIERNILNKIQPSEVEGSSWDPNSIMHYPFGPGLIVRPESYRGGIQPELGLSATDVARAKSFYPGDVVAFERLLPRGATVTLGAWDFDRTSEFKFICPAVRGECFRVMTEGGADTTLILQDQSGNQLAADDDSGFSRNALVKHWSRSLGDYVLLLRVVWAGPDREVRIVRPA